MLRRRAAVLLLALALGGAATACGADGRATPTPVVATGQAATTASGLVQTGLAQISAGQTEAAGASFRAALQIDPGNTFAHYNLGYLAQDSDRGTALREYDAALATDPHLVAALYNKALLLEDEDLDAAVRLYRQVIGLVPSNAAAHMRLGFALVHQGESRDGEVQLAAGLKLDPTMANIVAPSYGD